MKIGIANDHTGVEVKNQLKQFLDQLGYEVINYGTDQETSVDYPVYAFELCESLLNGDIVHGILICKTGIGMSIAANKVKGIRCAKADTVEEAKLTRLHNDSQVLALSALHDLELLKEICQTFLETEFSHEDRHIRRIKLMEDYEDEC